MPMAHATVTYGSVYATWCEPQPAKATGPTVFVAAHVTTLRDRGALSTRQGALLGVVPATGHIAPKDHGAELGQGAGRGCPGSNLAVRAGRGDSTAVGSAGGVGTAISVGSARAVRSAAGSCPVPRSSRSGSTSAGGMATHRDTDRDLHTDVSDSAQPAPCAITDRVVWSVQQALAARRCHRLERFAQVDHELMSLLEQRLHRVQRTALRTRWCIATAALPAPQSTDLETRAPHRQEGDERVQSGANAGPAGISLRHGVHQLLAGAAHNGAAHRHLQVA